MTSNQHIIVVQMFEEKKRLTMLIAIDIGNTDIVLGFMQDNEVVESYRIATNVNRSSDEYGLLLHQLLAFEHWDIDDVEDIIIASVVPKVMHAFRTSIIKFLDLQPIQVGPGIKTGLNIRIDEPKTLGADCLADCAGAHYSYGGDCLVIDCGTATTFNIVTDRAEITCGLIMPGLQSAVKSLSTSTAQLPQVEIARPSSSLATNTVHAIQAGIFYQAVGGIQYTIEQLKRDSGLDLYVVATGGLGQFLADEIEAIDMYDPDLIFKGMAYIYERNKRRR